MTDPLPEDRDSAERRTRLYVFPGGVFEIAHDGESDDGPGFYLEFQPSLPQRKPGVVAPEPVETADAETCRRALQLLRELDRPSEDRPPFEDGCSA